VLDRHPRAAFAVRCLPFIGALAPSLLHVNLAVSPLREALRTASNAPARKKPENEGELTTAPRDQTADKK
jgi:hypothetical protein